MNPINTKPDHGVPLMRIEGEDGRATHELQTYLDDLEISNNDLVSEVERLEGLIDANTTAINNNVSDISELNAVVLGTAILMPVYTVATLPAVGTHGLIHVSDETGGPVAAYSDGTDWRRASDGLVVA